MSPIDAANEPELFRDAFETSPIGLATVGLDGRWLRVNPQVCRIVDRSAEELCGGMTFMEVTHPDDVELDRAMAAELREGRRLASSLVKRYLRADGSVVPVRVTVSLVRDADGRPHHYIAQIEDRTEVEATERRFETLVAGLTDMVGILDEEGRWLWSSPAFRRILGVDNQIGHAFGERVHPDDVDEVRSAFGRLTAGVNDQDSSTFRVWSEPAQTWVWIEAAAADHRHDPAIGGFVVSARDVTERVETSEALRWQATHDPLTGLPNRWMLLERLREAAARATATGMLFAVLFFDLDDFKHVNDMLGHAAGDELLRVVASRLRTCLSDGELLARHGGDEFVVVTPPLAASEVESAIERYCGIITDVVQRPVRLEEQTVGVGVSIGAVADRGTRGEAELLRDADVAMYEAKAAGRGRWVLHESSMSDRARRRFEIRSALRLADDLENLVVHYQPVVDPLDDVVRGVEALSRIRLPDGSLLAPGEFVPVAEDTGAIVPIGAEVLRRATRAVSTWSADAFVSVNVSARQLIDDDFELTVVEGLAQAGLSPGRLVLELTESTILAVDDPRIVDAIRRLHNRGVRIALDDFGTGFSSIDNLRHLPVDYLKIDKSFVSRVAVVGSGDVAVVRAVLGMAAGLGIGVIAEGVETQLQATVLRELGPMLVQGFHFGAPDPQLPSSRRPVGHAGGSSS